MRKETRQEERVLERGNRELTNTSDAVQEGVPEEHSAETGPTTSPREQSPKRENESPAVKEEAQEGDSPDRTNATGLSGSPRSYRQSTTRWSEARFSTSPSSYRPSTARSSTRRSLSPSENGSRAVEERAQAELPVMLSDDDDDEVTFLSARTKPPDQVAETQGSPSRGSNRALTTGSARLGKERSPDNEQEEGTTEDLSMATTTRRSAPRKRKRVEPQKAKNTAVSRTIYSVAYLPAGNPSGDPYINVNIAAVSRDPCYQ